MRSARKLAECEGDARGRVNDRGQVRVVGGDPPHAETLVPWMIHVNEYTEQ